MSRGASVRPSWAYYKATSVLGLKAKNQLEEHNPFRLLKFFQMWCFVPWHQTVTSFCSSGFRRAGAPWKLSDRRDCSLTWAWKRYKIIDTLSCFSLFSVIFHEYPRNLMISGPGNCNKLGISLANLWHHTFKSCENLILAQSFAVGLLLQKYIRVFRIYMKLVA